MNKRTEKVVPSSLTIRGDVAIISYRKSPSLRAGFLPAITVSVLDNAEVSP